MKSGFRDCVGITVLIMVSIFAALTGLAVLAWAGTAKFPDVGVFLRCTGKTDPLEALKAVRSLGLDMVQVSKLPDHFYTPEGAKEFEGLLEQTGVHATSVVAVYDGESYKDIPTIRDTVGFRDTSLVRTRIEYTKKCIDFAAALHVKIVTFHVGFLPDDANDPLYQQMLRATTEVVQYAGTRGVTISLETGQEKAEYLLRFMDMIKGPKVGINFDMANLVLYGKDDSLSALKILFPRVTSVHVKDGEPPATPTALGKETRLGEGRGDSKACLEFLKSKHFTGPLIIENYVARRSPNSDPLTELALSKNFIDKVFAGK